MDQKIRKEDFYAYIGAGYKVIPVGKSAKNQGKAPLIKNYLDYDWDAFETHYDAVDQWFDYFGNSITGMGLPLGQHNNRGLSCIDIDSYDKEYIDKICKYFPSKIKRFGKKGCVLFFVSDGKHTKNYYKFDLPGNLGIIEVFYGGKQIVTAPSWHSDDLYYRWEDSFSTLLTVDYDDLPILLTKHVEAIGELVGSPTVSIANKNLPKSSQFKDGQNRTIAINSLMGRIFRSNPNPDINEVAKELLTYDATHFVDNSFFLDPRKGHVKTSDRSTNCLTYISSMATSFYNKNAEGFVFESPIETDTITFAKLVPVETHDSEIKEEFSLPVFHMEQIPQAWSDMIYQISTGQGIPAHVIFMAQMTALGACLQGNTIIKPIPYENFIRRTNLATAIVAESGSKKSDVVRNAVYECKKINKMLKTVNSKHDVMRIQDLEMKLEGLVKSKKDMIRKGEDVTHINNEILSTQMELEEKPLQGTDWMYENATIQQMIVDSMNNQKTGLFVIKDEMKQLMTDFKKKGNEDARTFYMKGIDGNDSFEYKTISRGKNTVEKLFISLLTNVQPDVLSVYINQLYSAYGDNDGFLQRITLVPYGMPIAVKTRPVDFSKFAKQYEHFNRAFYSPMTEVMIDPAVEDYYREQRLTLQMNAIKFHGLPITSILAKHEGLLCVYAYLYEFLNSEGKPKTISKDSIDQAMKLLSWLGDCSKYLFNIRDKQQDKDILKTVADMLTSRHFVSGSTQSEMYQKIRAGFKFPTPFYKALKDLEIRGYVKVIYNKQNSAVVHINPDIFLL